MFLTFGLPRTTSLPDLNYHLKCKVYGLTRLMVLRPQVELGGANITTPK